MRHVSYGAARTAGRHLARLWCVAIALSFAAYLFGPSVYAQVPDTTVVPDTAAVPATTAVPDTAAVPGAGADLPSDTTQVGADTTLAGAPASAELVPPVGFDPIWRGRPATDTIPALLPGLDLVDLIGREPSSFTYQFGTPGWPDGWSIQGLPPQAAALTFNDLPFDHLFTGRPAFNLVPLALLEAPQLAREHFGRPAAVLTNLRPFATPEPATEGRFWQGGDGLQSIEAVHAQHRLRPLFGNPGFLNILGAYTGRAADGEYPGSRLRRARQVLLRTRYEQRNWALEIFNLHNRRSVGAHGGVVRNPNDPGSIYIRPGATVINPDALRRIVRNDLAASFRVRLLEDASTLSLFWTAETFRFSTPADTLGTRSNRLGVLVAQPLVRTALHGLTITAAAWRDGISPRYGFQRGDESSGFARASIRDTLSTDRWRTSLEAGAAVFDEGIRPVGSASLSAGFGAFGFEAGASLSDVPAPVASRTGFGSMLGLGGAAPGHIASGRLMLSFDAGAVDVVVGGFANRRFSPVDYFEVDGDSAAVVDTGGALDALGAYADLGWRRDAERGLYGEVRPAFFRFRGDGSLNERLAETLPEVTGSARLGARFVLFEGDLDIDAYGELIAWSQMRSRRLHPQTGLLIVPQAGSDALGPSSILNVAVEAGVREATIFLVYENALAGTELMIGNMIVPAYPLPDRRFRFGVFWPIFG